MLAKRRRSRRNDLGRRDQRIALLVGQRDDLGRVVGRDLEPGLERGSEFRRQLVGRVGARRARGGDQRRRGDRQLGRGRGLGEIAALVDRVLDLVDHVLDRLLALVGVELGGDLGASPAASDLPPSVLTASTLTTTQPKSDWIGPTTAPEPRREHRSGRLVAGDAGIGLAASGRSSEVTAAFAPAAAAAQRLRRPWPCAAIALARRLVGDHGLAQRRACPSRA